MTMAAIPPTQAVPRRGPTKAQAQRGRDAERKCQQWLDRCRLPYLYVEQSPLTVPEGLAGAIKRPDWMIGIPSVGTIAFDVKAKTTYRDHLLIDALEHRKFRNFEAFFNITVWYVCFPPDEPYACHLFRNRELDRLRPEPSRGKPTFWMPLSATHFGDTRRDIAATLINAISLRNAASMSSAPTSAVPR